jgi:hypothetical protein
VALSQSGRATLRYNESTNDLEISRDGAAYEAIDIGGVPAGSPWKKTGSIVELVTSSDDVVVGGSVLLGPEKFRVVGLSQLDSVFLSAGSNIFFDIFGGDVLVRGQTAVGAGNGGIDVVGGQGGPGSGATDGGAGGKNSMRGGKGGTGTGAGGAAGAGAIVELIGGGGGVDGGSGGGAGGDAFVTAGGGTGGEVDGSVFIGTNNTDAVRIGVPSNKLGFYGIAPVVKPTITGAKGGNAALTDLLTELALLGLIINSTS